MEWRTELKKKNTKVRFGFLKRTTKLTKLQLDKETEDSKSEIKEETLLPTPQKYNGF